MPGCAASWLCHGQYLSKAAVVCHDGWPHWSLGEMTEVPSPEQQSWEFHHTRVLLVAPSKRAVMYCVVPVARQARRAGASAHV